MKTNSHLTEATCCDAIQATFSAKIDTSQPFSAKENDHLQSCSECHEFVDFMLSDNFSEIASIPMSASNDLTDSIMQRLQASDKAITPRPNQWRKIISIASLAAAAAVMISIILNDQKLTNNSELTSHTQSQPVVAALDEEIIKENLQNQYHAISLVADEKWTKASANIISAKDYLSEKTERLSDILLFNSSDGPQSSNEDPHSTKV